MKTKPDNKTVDEVEGTRKSTFVISKMDCPSEEQLVRMNLAQFPDIRKLAFDLPQRKLDIYHGGEHEPIDRALSDLNLGSRHVETSWTEDPIEDETHGLERRILWIVLSINLFFFVAEIVTGIVSGSMGLVADSLDMLADCLVFALSLYAVGSTIARKKNVARISGYFQLTLAVFGLIEVVRRFLGFGEVPEYQLMIIVSTLALIGNAASLYILQKGRSEEAHMQASYIFLSNDVVINIGVTVAGVFVFLTASKLPDLVVGTLIFLVVARGAYRILRLSR